MKSEPPYGDHAPAQTGLQFDLRGAQGKLIASLIAALLAGDLTPHV